MKSNSTLSRYRPIAFVILCTLFTATGQLLWKAGVNQNQLTLGSFFSFYILLGFFSFGVGGIFLMLALQKGSLSVIHPFLSLGYLLVTLGAIFFLGEEFTWGIAIALIFILAGLILLTRGEQR